MVSLEEKIALVSGASSGIGEATAERLAAAGAHLILCARNLNKLEEVAKRLEETYEIKTFVRKVDVQNRNDVETMIRELPAEWKNIDILVNNAGLALGLEKLHEGDPTDWEIMLDTNVKGLLYMSRQVVPLMTANGRGGIIINIGSIAGIHAYPGGAVYCACKAAVKFISDGLRMDVVDQPIRVTNVQPGMVETNFSVVRFHGDQAKADGVYDGIQPLVAEDIADIVLYAATVPPHVQICEVTVTPTHQATGGVVYKQKK